MQYNKFPSSLSQGWKIVAKETGMFCNVYGLVLQCISFYGAMYIVLPSKHYDFTLQCI